MGKVLALARQTQIVEYSHIEYDAMATNCFDVPRKLVHSSIKVVTAPGVANDIIAGAVKRYAEETLNRHDVAIEKIYPSGNIFLEV